MNVMVWARQAACGREQVDQAAPVRTAPAGAQIVAGHGRLWVPQLPLVMSWKECCSSSPQTAG